MSSANKTEARFHPLRRMFVFEVAEELHALDMILHLECTLIDEECTGRNGLRVSAVAGYDLRPPTLALP